MLHHFLIYLQFIFHGHTYSILVITSLLCSAQAIITLMRKCTYKYEMSPYPIQLLRFFQRNNLGHV
jgi:hypothetical protein